MKKTLVSWPNGKQEKKKISNDKNLVKGFAERLSSRPAANNYS
jgi:hypothetical protein